MGLSTNQNYYHLYFTYVLYINKKGIKRTTKKKKNIADEFDGLNKK